MEKFNIDKEIEELSDPVLRKDLVLKLKEEWGFSTLQIHSLLKLSMSDESRSEYQRNNYINPDEIISERLEEAIKLLLTGYLHPVTGLPNSRIMELQIRKKIHSILLDDENKQNESIIRTFIAEFKEVNENATLSIFWKIKTLEKLREKYLSKLNFTIVAADATGFKQVNDKLGHKEGDNALRMIASVIQKGINKAGDEGMFGNIYHLGGDEFDFLFYTLDVENSNLNNNLNVINDELAKKLSNEEIEKLTAEDREVELMKFKIADKLGTNMKIDFASLHISYAITTLIEICLIKDLNQCTLCNFNKNTTSGDDDRRFYPLIENISEIAVKLADRKAQITKNYNKLEELVNQVNWLPLFELYRRGLGISEDHMKNIIKHVIDSKLNEDDLRRYLLETSYKISTIKKDKKHMDDDDHANEIIDRVAYDSILSAHL